MVLIRFKLCLISTKSSVENKNISYDIMVKALITITSTQRPPPDLRPVGKVPPKLWSNPHGKPPDSSHLQSTAKGALGVVRITNFTSNLLQTN